MEKKLDNFNFFVKMAGIRSFRNPNNQFQN